EGFAERDHCAEGIHDRLKATAIALSDGSSRAVIISLDILDFPDSLVDTIWRKVQTHYHLDPRQILINSSHTHAGPMTWPRIRPKDCPNPEHYVPDERYIRILIENILTAVGKALGNIRPAHARWGCGETRIGICRRARDVSVYQGAPSGYLGIFANYPNPGKEVDRTCPVILFSEAEGRPLACIFGASCHPTTMSHDNYFISAEFPGAARQIIEDRIGAPALFLQGIGGDVKPRRVVEEGSFRSGTFADVEAVGTELAADALRVLDAGLQPLDLRLRHALKRFPIPLAPGWEEAAYRRYLGEEHPVHRRVWAEWWLEKYRSGEPVPRELFMTLSILELSDDLRLLGIAGELLTDMGLKLKELFPGTTLPLGYSNGRTAYIPDSNVLREGGYEALESVFFTPGMPAPWREDIDDNLMAAFQALQQDMELE
ncbi:MAG: neutral/alkaline non-lysosomal ceramidase N-terminal domain-containing protein, partial [Candidatus Latescibacterota bacterium]